MNIIIYFILIFFTLHSYNAQENFELYNDVSKYMQQVSGVASVFYPCGLLL